VSLGAAGLALPISYVRVLSTTNFTGRGSSAALVTGCSSRVSRWMSRTSNTLFEVSSTTLRFNNPAW
jgi:hypothetical protein